MTTTDEAEPAATTVMEQQHPALNEPADIDEERRRRQATYFASILNRVRNWLAECLGEDLVPSAYDLEESLRTGVLLARLANYFAPEMVPLEKVFDLDLSKFNNGGLVYRHTDNILKWHRACKTLKLNPIILPEPVDVYSGNNVRTIFALIALSKRLHRMGKAPPLREHTDFVLTDDDYRVIAERMDQAAENEGIDWEQLQQERHTIESLDFNAENMSSASTAEEHVDTSEPTVQSLRYLCKSLDISHNLYDRDLLLEDQKIRANKLLESNDAMRKDLEELEANIGLLVKNFRSIKDNTDKKAELDRKLEIEKACQMQSSTLNNLSSDEDSVYNDENSASSYDGEEPRSLARVSRQTVDSHHGDRLPLDYMLYAKSHVLTLLHDGLQGDTIKELATTKDLENIDEKDHDRIAEMQTMLSHVLQKLIDTHKISNDGVYGELLTAIFWDIRNEEERERAREERQKEVDALLERASKEAQQMMAQIQAYRDYEHACLKNMSGGAPSIKLSDELNKKIRKFLNRKQKAVNKQPVKLNSEKMIKKKIVFCDDMTTPKKISKYSIVIYPQENPGEYRFESVVDGNVKHSQTIIFEELLRREALGQYRLPFDDPLVFDCLGLRRFLDRAYHSKAFI